jgi:hypothetical protein
MRKENLKMRYVGTTEDRINKWMRMCLQWQFDIRRGTERRPNYYFTKYHVGKYKPTYFSDLKDSIVDREYVINKMNLISEDRMLRDRSLGQNSNKVIIKQVNQSEYVHCPKGVKINDNTIVKTVIRSKYSV